MVLEGFVSPARLERQPWLMLGITFIFASAALLLAYSTFPRSAGLFIVALTIMPAIPLFLRVLIKEEKKEERVGCGVIETYKPLILLYGYFFIGCALAYAFWAFVLPQETTSRLFAEQIAEQELVASFLPRLTFDAGTFQMIFLHNLWWLTLLFVFSLFYSIGALFLLAWNASLVAIVLQDFARQAAAALPQNYLGATAAFVIGVGQGGLSLLPHGIFEVSAFFVASIAGGALSIAIERCKHREGWIKVRAEKICYRRKSFAELVEDSAKLFLLALVLLAIGAFVEASY